MMRTARRSRRYRKTGAASIRVLGPIGTRRRRFRTEKWLPARGAIFPCRPLVTMITLLDHDDAVTMVMTPAAMPATIVVHLGAGAVPAMMMAVTTLDDDGLGAGDRRQ